MDDIPERCDGAPNAGRKGDDDDDDHDDDDVDHDDEQEEEELSLLVNESRE
jgi:hypothetical protein